ncbi:SprT family zinc-dependent metalloprotease [Vibrio salinus]|uniref:SprT family zinc-dependent metalloprotease n=1 Tax=Vibrio salinus TaxID=2899784 RepID=UPI001E5C1E19|nr:SprT family zinc-dependent metalloprotease [Vibrio salinus]MCE0494135.1 SprT family zinc-dependent metalloprotease [Vibrio salinus]
MINDEQLLNAATDTLKKCLSTANRHFSVSYPLPEINFRLRGKSAGKAYLQKNEIRLNKRLFSDNYQAFIDEVIPHELAHLVAFQYFGKVKPHGKEWKYIMSEVFGSPARATHQFDVSAVAGKQFTYQCHCSTHLLSIRRHNNVQRGKAEYRCRRCLTPLIYIKE